MIVVACNSVSAVALNEVIQQAGDVPVIGMISPAAEAAVRQTNNGNIGVIGTRATVNSKAYLNSIYEMNNDSVNVISQECPLFVPIVEEGLIRHPASKMYAEEYLSVMKKNKVDTLVLGCTHYPLMSDLFREIMPGINLIDSGEHSAVKALRILADEGTLKEADKNTSQKPKLDFYVTDLPTMFHELAKRFLGFDIEQPIKVTID